MAPSPPPSRGVLRKSVQPPPALGTGERVPALPPRGGAASASLMDEDDGELSGWQPLRPQ